MATVKPGTRPDTRARILDVAWKLVRERGVGAVTIAEIARAAGVSRQLVYLYFEHRAGLLRAMARRQDARSGFAGAVDSAAELPPVEALESLLRSWYAYVPEILPVARALEAAAITGDEGAAAWHDRMGDLQKVFRRAAERLEREGRLAAGWTVRTAAEWIWARSHLETWQHLVAERGWRPDEYAERSIRSILTEVVAPPPPRARKRR